MSTSDRWGTSRARRAGARAIRRCRRRCGRRCGSGGRWPTRWPAPGGPEEHEVVRRRGRLLAVPGGRRAGPAGGVHRPGNRRRGVDRRPGRRTRSAAHAPPGSTPVGDRAAGGRVRRGAGDHRRHRAQPGLRGRVRAALGAGEPAGRAGAGAVALPAAARAVLALAGARAPRPAWWWPGWCCCSVCSADGAVPAAQRWPRTPSSTSSQDGITGLPFLVRRLPAGVASAAAPFAGPASRPPGSAAVSAGGVARWAVSAGAARSAGGCPAVGDAVRARRSGLGGRGVGSVARRWLGGAASGARLGLPLGRRGARRCSVRRRAGRGRSRPASTRIPAALRTAVSEAAARSSSGGPGRRRRLLRPGDVDHRADRAQRPRRQALDQVAGVLVERGDGAAVRPGWNVQCARLSERPARQDSATTHLPSSPFQESHSASVYSWPRSAEGVRDDVAEHSGVGAVGAHRVRPLGHLGGPGPLQQHRVGEALDLLRGHAGRRGHLLHGRSGADAGLDLTWTQLALQLDRDLSEPGQVSPGGSTQLLVGRDRVALAATGILEDDRRRPR